MPKKVSAAIVTYRGYEKAYRAVETLLSHTHGVELTLYIIDNASGDRTAERLKEAFPSVELIETQKNLGFGYGHNTVLSRLDSDYHAVINPDIAIDSDVLFELALYLDEHPDVGLVTPKILNMDGSDQMLPKRDPTVASLVGRRIFKGLLKHQVAHYQMLDSDISKPLDIEFATGCFFLIRTELFKQLGGFDTRFFLYYEDMDITRRARSVSRTVYYPCSHVYHAWERSSAGSPVYFTILLAGMFKYFGKWGWRFGYPRRDIKKLKKERL